MMLRPRDSHDQRLIEATLEITPEPSELHLGARCVRQLCRDRPVRPTAADELRFDSMIRLDHWPTNELDFQFEDYARIYPFAYAADEAPDLMRSIERQYLDPRRVIDRWARQFLHREGPTDTRELLASMTHAIKHALHLPRREEAGTQDPVVTLQLAAAVAVISRC